MLQYCSCQQGKYFPNIFTARQDFNSLLPSPLSDVTVICRIYLTLLETTVVIIIADRKRCNFGPSIFTQRSRESTARRLDVQTQLTAGAYAPRQASNLLYGTCCRGSLSFALFSPGISSVSSLLTILPLDYPEDDV